MDMTIDLARRAIRLFPAAPYLPLAGVKYNRRAWVRAVLDLGDRWILAEKVERKTK